MYTRRPLGTIIHAAALTTSTITLAYGLYIAHNLIEYLSSKPASDSHNIKMLLVSLFLVTLVRIFFVIVSFLHLFTPNIIMPMYKSGYCLILSTIHIVFSVMLSIVAVWIIAGFGEPNIPAVHLTMDGAILIVASISMLSGLDDPLLPWRTATPSEKSGELTEQMV